MARAAADAPDDAQADTSRLASLVRAMASGERDALAAIYGETVAKVFAIARGVLRSKEDAEEIVCDVYTQAWKNAASFDPARGSVMAWLAIMARNKALDRLRQRRDLVSIDGDENQELTAMAGQAPGPEDILQRFQSGSEVRRALQTLNPERRRLLGLAFFQGLSHSEIAQVVGMPLGTVKSHVRRALAALQTTLGSQA
jgi:RNA polymerase sigma-70 factor (ECF subfamily)